MIPETFRSGSQMHEVQRGLCLEFKIVELGLAVHLVLVVVVMTSWMESSLILWRVHLTREAVLCLLQLIGQGQVWGALILSTHLLDRTVSFSK